MTSPPLLRENLDLSRLRAKIVYIRLHGIEGQAHLYSDPGWYTVISAEDMENADFSECTIFLEGCHGDEMVNAFLKAGADVVLGNKDSTWGRRWRMGPSSKVGKWWLKNIRLGMSPSVALGNAVKKVKAPFNRGWIAAYNNGVTEI